MQSFPILSQFLWQNLVFCHFEAKTWEPARGEAVWAVLHTFTSFPGNGLDFPFSSNLYWSHTPQTLFFNLDLHKFPVASQTFYLRNNPIKVTNWLQKNVLEQESLTFPPFPVNYTFRLSSSNANICSATAAALCCLTYQGQIWHLRL